MVYLSVGFLLIVSGFLVRKYPGLIAGYNTMSEYEKSRFDIDGFSRLLKVGLIAIGILLIVIHPLLNFVGMAEYSILFFLAFVLIGTLVMIIAGQAFKR